MNHKPLVPRLLARPHLWWITAAILAFLAFVSIGVRYWAGKTQSELLRQGGWEVYDLTKVDSKIQSNDAIWYLTLAPDEKIWARTGKGSISLSFDGQGWQIQKLVDGWPLGSYKAIDVFDNVINLYRDGRIWTGDQYCSGSSPDQWCSCMITSESKTKKEAFKFDIPDSSCGNVSGITVDQAGKLWATFRAREESRFGLASYAEKQWTFYETGDILDPLLKPDRFPDFYGARYLVPDFNGDLWLSLYSHPYIVRIDPTTSNLSADPVPDGIILTRRISNTFAWSTGVLFGIVALVAAWSTFLSSRAGLAWAQHLRVKSTLSTTAPQPPAQSLPVYKSRRFIILTIGFLFAIWSVVWYRYWLYETGYWEIALSWQGILIFAGFGFALGTGSAAIIYSGNTILNSSSSPLKRVWGFIVLILGVLFFVASLWLTRIIPGLYFTG